MNELHLFSGAGGGILGGILLGHTCVCAVEIEPYCRKVLLQRQRDGILPRFPIWDDVRTFDGRPWRGLVDVVCAGIPCQKVSAAGKGGGFTSEDYYQAFVRIVREIGSPILYLENSPLLTIRGLGDVLRDLAALGMDARWGVLGAQHVGAPHERKRIWILAYRRCERSAGGRGIENMACQAGTTQGDQEKRKWLRDASLNSRQTSFLGNADNAGLQGFRLHGECARERLAWSDGEIILGADGKRRLCPPGVPLLVDGMAGRVDRIRASGNGQVPAVAALAWETLSAPSVPNGTDKHLTSQDNQK